MKKLKRSIIYLIITAFVVGSVFIVTKPCFSQEKLLVRYEKAEHFGPSDEILYLNDGRNTRGHGIVIGKGGDMGLSVLMTEKRFFGNYAGLFENSVFKKCGNAVNAWYDDLSDTFFGITYDRSAKTVSAFFESSDGAPISLETEVRPDGFFVIPNVREALREEGETVIETPEYLYARTAYEGNEGCTSFDVRDKVPLRLLEANKEYPLDWGPLISAADGDLDSDVINYLNSCFLAGYNVSQYINNTLYNETRTNPNSAACFLIQDFEDPGDLDLFLLLRHFPNELEHTEALEKAIIGSDQFKDDYSDWGKEIKSFEDLPTPVHIYKREPVDEAMEYYLGIRTGDLKKRNAAYLESEDIFWHYVSDYGPGYFDISYGMKAGTEVELVYEEERFVRTLHLTERDGRYIMTSLKTEEIIR